MMRDLAAADRAGDYELAQAIAAQIKGGSKPGFEGARKAYAFLQGGQDLPQNLIRFLSQFDDEETKNRANELAQRREEGIKEISGGESDLWRLGGSLTAGGLAGAPGAVGGKMLTRAMERIGNAVGEGGLFGAMSPDLNAKEGAAVGGGVASVLEGLGKVGKVPGAVGRTVARVLPMTDEARRADQFAKSRGVPVAGEDLVTNNLVRSTGRVLDAADPTNFRARQLESYEDAFRREIVDPYADFDDPIAEMGESLGRQYKAVKDTSKDMYEAAYKQLNQYGDLPLPEFQYGLKELKSQYTKLLGEGSAEVREIDKWMGYQDATFEEWAKRRQKLGRDIRKLQRGSDTDHVDLELMTGIRSALDKNLDYIGKENGLYRRANSFYVENVVPYKEDAYRKLVKKGEYEKAINDALSKAPSAQTMKRFNQVWGSLDEQGKSAYRQQMLQSIMDVAQNPETRFSPNAAATQIDRLKNRLGDDVLPPDLVKALDGWNNLFRQSGFSAEALARSRTGASLTQVTTPFAMAAGVMAAPGLTATAVAPFMPALLVRSRKIRNMLAKLSEMNPKHPDYSTVTEDVMREITSEANKLQALQE